MAFDLVPFESIKDFLELREASVKDYPALGVIKDNMLAAFEAELGRGLELKSRTEVVRVGTFERNYIDLIGLPISSIESVQSTDIYGDVETLDSDEYYITEGGIYILAGVKQKTITVTYTGGYATVPPAAIVRAALIQISYEFQTKEHIGAQSVTTEGGTVSTPPLQLLQSVKEILDGFKHPGRIA